MKYFLILIVLFLFTYLVFAQAPVYSNLYSPQVTATVTAIIDYNSKSHCVEYNLKAPGGSMEKVPVRDQTNIGSCYAYAASGIVDAWRFSHDDKDYGFSTSPHAIAVASKAFLTPEEFKTVGDLEEDDALIEGGFIEQALLATKALGACNYKKFGDRFGLYNGTSKAFIKDLESFYIIYNDVAKFKAAKEKKPMLTEQQITEQLNCKLQSGGISSTLNSKEVTEILATNSLNDYLKSLLDKVCKDSMKKVNIPEAIAATGKGLPKDERMGKLSNFVEAMLKAGNKQPVGITYCSSVLTAPNSTKINDITGAIESETCGAHASLIIGRRLTGAGQCQFLVRNSWGQNYHYPAGITTDEDGDIWLDEEDLLRNTWAVTSLNNK